MHPQKIVILIGVALIVRTSNNKQVIVTIRIIIAQDNKELQYFISFSISYIVAYNPMNSSNGFKSHPLHANSVTIILRKRFSTSKNSLNLLVYSNNINPQI